MTRARLDLNLLHPTPMRWEDKRPILQAVITNPGTLSGTNVLPPDHSGQPNPWVNSARG